jgi:hypothetical protein
MSRRLAVFQYPYHGVRDAIPNVERRCIDVFAVGIANHYGHPSRTVLYKSDVSFIVNE